MSLKLDPHRLRKASFYGTGGAAHAGETDHTARQNKEVFENADGTEEAPDFHACRRTLADCRSSPCYSAPTRVRGRAEGK